MVNVTAVGVERTLSVENAAEEGKDRVTERYREREQRNQERICATAASAMI